MLRVLVFDGRSFGLHSIEIWEMVKAMSAKIL